MHHSFYIIKCEEFLEALVKYLCEKIESNYVSKSQKKMMSVYVAKPRRDI